MKSEKISLKDARKLALLSQRVLTPNRKGRAMEATRKSVQHLSYIQIDTISVVERAHHHTLWNRNPRYRPSHLSALMANQSIFEYWSHAAAYLPMSDYRFSLPFKNAIKTGGHPWFDCDKKIKSQVLKRITEEGPLQSKDFENHGKTRLPMWEWKPAKYALEQLFMEGKTMVVRRDSFQKVYDLTERVLPDSVDQTEPTDTEFSDYLIDRYINAHGFGNAVEISYLRKGQKQNIQTRVQEQLEAGKLIAIRIGSEDYITRPGLLERLQDSLPRSRARILSPFDNLVIQRKRIQQIFDFDYQIECYVTEKKRKFGYFCLPILWNGELVARMDSKADRKTGTFIIRNLVLEPKLKHRERFTAALVKELGGFMAFNECTSLALENIPDKLISDKLTKSFIC